MECTKNLDTKYQNLATEYSKLRANAAVLKKAVLDEQARSRELKDQLKEHEQQLRKSNQEMESLTFRNQQLTKRISVLQEELDLKTTGKRTKGKLSDHSLSITKPNVTLLDEELQKKIMDNAQLISAMTDKDLEISNLREILTELEEKLLEEQKQRITDEQRHNEQVNQLRRQHSTELKKSESRTGEAGAGGDIKQNGDIYLQYNTLKQQTLQLQSQLEHLKTEYELLVSERCDGAERELEPHCEQKTKDYFYQRIDGLMCARQEAEGRAGSLAAECSALQERLVLALNHNCHMENKLDSSLNTITKLQEELQTTSHNYEQQLSTMSEHLADLNDKYTEQCELIQQLNFQINNTRAKKNTK